MSRNRIRQVETAKWLEHHFGSESTRSSTGNLSEDENEDDTKDARGHQRTTSNSFINVTMKSTETPPANGYFKGVSEWNNNRNASAPIRPPIRRKKGQKVEIVNGGAVNELESSPLFSSVQQRVQGYELTKEKLSGRNAINGHQSRHNGHAQVRRFVRSRSRAQPVSG